MFEAVRQRWRDVATLNRLFASAEAIANQVGQQRPGAEHLVQAALGLPDQTAQRVLQRLGVDASAQGFAAAVERQHRLALQQVGLEVEDHAPLAEPPLPVPAARGAFVTQPSAQALMQTLTRDIMRAAQKRDARTPLVGAHVLLAAASAPHGICARAFRALGCSPQQVAQAARDELAAAPLRASA